MEVSSRCSIVLDGGRPGTRADYSLVRLSSSENSKLVPSKCASLSMHWVVRLLNSAPSCNRTYQRTACTRVLPPCHAPREESRTPCFHRQLHRMSHPLRVFSFRNCSV